MSTAEERLLGVSVDPCPECRSGKCLNCTATTLDHADNEVPCPCREAGHS